MSSLWPCSLTVASFKDRRDLCKEMRTIQTQNTSSAFKYANAFLLPQPHSHFPKFTVGYPLGEEIIEPEAEVVDSDKL